MQDAIDLLHPDTKPLSELLALLPGEPVSKTTLWRWHTTGFAGRKLRVARYGGQLYTTAAELRDFVNHVGSTPVSAAKSGPPPMDEKRRATMERGLARVRRKRGSSV